MSKRKIRVLHFMSHGFIGGQERALYQLFKSFKQDEDFQFGVAISQKRGFYIEKIKELNIPIINLGLKSGFHLKIDRKLFQQSKEYQIHHFHDPSPIEILFSIISNPMAIRVLTRRGGIINYKKYGIMKLSKHLINSLLYKNFFSGFSANTINAALSIERIYGIKNKKIHILYNGIDFESLKPTIERGVILKELHLTDSEFKIGTACHLLDWKRVDMVIKAFSLCKVREKKLLIFGKGPELIRLKKLSKLLSLEEQIIFVGEVTNMSDFMQIFDCFVLASGAEESFGNVVVEAMYLKVPTIIMDDSPGLKEHIVDNETGFIASNIVDLAIKMKYIYNNPLVSKAIAQKASNYVINKYTLANMKSAYKNFYYEILNSIEY